MGIEVTPSDSPAGRVAEVTRSLVERGSLEPETFRAIARQAAESSRALGRPSWQDAFTLGRHGELFPKHALLSAILVVPFFAVFGEAGFWIFQQLAAMLLIFYTFRLASYICDDKVGALALVVITLGTQTVFGLYTYTFSYDLHAALLVIMGLYYLRTRPLWGGLLVGLSVFMRPSHVLLLPFLLYSWRGEGASQRRDGLLGTAAALGLYGFVNHLMYGSPWLTPYQRLPGFDAQGQMLLMPHEVGFSLQTLCHDWGDKLFSSKVGLILFNPVVILVPFCFIVIGWHKERRFLALTLSASLFYALYVFSYSAWPWSHLGNRYLMPSIYLSLLSLMVLLHSVWKRVTGKSN